MKFLLTEDFFEASQSLIEDQTNLVLVLRQRIDALPSEDLRRAFGPLEDHFQQRLDALRPLVTASMSGTQQEMDEALAVYRETASPEAALGMIEAILLDPTVESILRGQGIEPSQILDLFEETFLGSG